MQIKLLMISQNLKPDESIVIPRKDMAEAARGELESLLLDYLHPGDIEKFAEKISKNWKITMTEDVMTGDYVMHKPALQKTSGRLYKFVMPVFSKGDEVIVSLPGGPQQGKIFAIYRKYGWTNETKYEVRGKNLVTITSARTMKLCNG